MTSTEDIKTALSAKLDALLTLHHIDREEGAVVRSPGETDEVHCLGQKREMAALVFDALKRIGSETYGLCSECEQRISPRRLAAVPWAKYCMKCQESKEGYAAEVRWGSAA
jgi:DnaK suppressor protein